MPKIMNYNRENVVKYAEKWALRRNPGYYDFSNLGGDCTNFCSQCLYAGSGIMNYTSVHGWFYSSAEKRTPLWTGVNFLYNFLTTNKKRGPFAVQTDIEKIEVGDIIQLGNSKKGFYHSLVVTLINGVPSEGTIYISTHTMDFFNRLLNQYIYEKIRFLSIGGVYV